MSNQWHRLILALAATGVAAGAWAQNAPDSAAGAGPEAGGGPPHAWRGDDAERGGGGHGPRQQWGEDGQAGEDGGPPWHHHHHHHDGDRGGFDDGEHGHDGMMGHGGGMLFRGLNLTPEQHQKIRILVMSARLEAMKQAGVHKPGDMAALMNPGDPNYKAAVEAAKKRATDRIQRMSGLKQQIYGVLTPEQKSELGKRIADWKTRMAQRDAKGPPAPAAR